MKQFIDKVGPFVKSKEKSKTMMRNLLIALLPIVIFAVYKNGYIPYSKGYTNVFGLFYPLLFIIIGMLSTFLTELLYSKIFFKDDYKNYFKNSYSLIPGLFLGLILPINTPIILLILGGFVAIILGKMLFGGFGNNIFNPALIGSLFIGTSYTALMGKSGIYLNGFELDAITKATPLTNIGGIQGIGTYETIVAPFGSLWDFFIGTIPGAIGETSALLCLVGFIYLTITKTIKWRIPTLYILTVFIMTAIIGSLNGVGIWYPLFHILSGGLMLGAVFMATDPVTSPTTKYGQLLFGISLGILTVFARIFTNYPEGVLTSILTMNMFVFILDKIGAKAPFKGIKKYISLAILVIFGLGLSFVGSLKFEVVDDKTDKNFNILDVSIKDDTYIYKVTQKGFYGLIEADITISNSLVTNIKVNQIKDDFYNIVIDNNYIDKLILEQKNINNVDTISGATRTSGALRAMVENTLKDYGDKYEK